MSDHNTIPEPDNKLLRQFGFILGSGLIIIFGLLFPFFSDRPVPTWPFVAAAVFAGAGLVCPAVLGPVFRVWMKIGHVLGWVNTRILLGLVFFIILFPMSLIMRVLGKDPMARTLRSGEPTYRVPSRRHGPGNLERPF